MLLRYGKGAGSIPAEGSEQLDDPSLETEEVQDTYLKVKVHV